MPTNLVRNTPEAAGREFGAQLDRFSNKLAAKHPEIPERCQTCAFRAGTWPNGCVTTVMDAMKCAMENVDFMCHEKHRAGHLCSGYQLMKFENPVQAPWHFSDEHKESNPK